MKRNYANANRTIYKAKSFIEKYYVPNNNNTDQTPSQVEKRMRFLEQAKSKCWEEALQISYDPFQDYSDMVIQIGLVTFFSTVFPLAPLIAFINNVLLIRVHAYKICYTRQRPVSHKISGIGVWEDVLQIMSIGLCILFIIYLHQI